jgi:hypothetical protein
VEMDACWMVTHKRREPAETIFEISVGNGVPDTMLEAIQ